MGKGTVKITHVITKRLTLNPEAQHQNSPYCSQPFPSHFTHNTKETQPSLEGSRRSYDSQIRKLGSQVNTNKHQVIGGRD